MKSLLTAFLLLFALNCFAQKQGRAQLDSLLAEVLKANSDTNAVNLYNSIAFAYSRVQPDSGLLFAAKAQALAEQLNYRNGLAYSYVNSGVNYGQKSDFQANIRYQKKALMISRDQQDQSGIGTSLFNIGHAHFSLNEYPTALEYYFQALKIFEARKQEDRLAILHNNIGLVYTFIKEYDKAIAYYQKALPIYKKTGNKSQEARVTGNIGLVYHFRNDPARALTYDLKALALYEELGERNGIAINTINAGSSYVALRDLPKAVSYFSRALALFKEAGDAENAACAIGNIGESYLLAAKEEPAVSTSLPPYDLPKRERLLKARTLLEQSIAESKAIPDLENIKNTALLLTEVQELLGDHVGALESYRLSISSRDSLFTQEHKNQIAGLESKREAELKQKELEIQGLKLQKAENQRWYLLGALGMLLLLLGLVYNRYRLKQRKNRQLEQAYTDLEHMQGELLQKEKSLFAKQLLEIELKALRAQMNPHFIFNCLNSIQAIILNEDKRAATDYLQKFSRLIRLILDNSRKESTTLEDEAEILTLYLDLEQLRMSHKFEYEIDIPDEVESAFTEFPSMVIQPLVENSIWHGLMPAEGKGQLRISFRRDEDQLTCVVEDNGIGRKRSQQMKGSHGHDSKGLKLIEERLQAWSRTRDLECRIRVLDTTEYGTGTRTEIIVQYAPVLAYA